jgi:hypothetical protein
MTGPRFRSGRLACAGLGAAVVAAYLVAAVVSGRLSPLARHPLLDGFQTAVPYNWVHPPPDQAGTNKQPSSAAKTLSFANQGASGFISTPDKQALLIIGKRTFELPAAEGQTGVHITIAPLDPATLAALPKPLVPSGNAYLVRGAFQPSGDAVASFTAPVTITLIYPAAASSGLTPPTHTLLWSKDGRTWTKLKTIDSHGGLQAAGTLQAPGYVVVGAPPQPAAAQEASRLRALAIGILVALAVFVVAGLIYVLRSRRRGEE